MKIYLDLYIIKNFIFNLLLIVICGKLLNLKVNLKKYILSATVGTMFALIALIMNDLLVSYFLKVVIGLIMIVLAYPIVSLKNVLNSSAIFLLLTSFIGGNIVAIKIETKFLAQIIGFAFSTLIFYVLWKAYKSRQIFENLKCKIKVMYDNQIIEATAFIDTGNNLKDVVSGETVIFIYEDKLEKELPKEIIKILKAEVLELDEKYFGKIKMLTYKGVDNESKITIGMKVENILIEYDNKKIKNGNVIIAISKTKFNGCEALIGQNTLEEGYIYGNDDTFKNASKKIME